MKNLTRWISLFLMIAVVFLLVAWFIPPLFASPIIPTIDIPSWSDIPPIVLLTP